MNTWNGVWGTKDWTKGFEAHNSVMRCAVEMRSQKQCGAPEPSSPPESDVEVRAGRQLFQSQSISHVFTEWPAAICPEITSCVRPCDPLRLSQWELSIHHGSDILHSRVCFILGRKCWRDHFIVNTQGWGHMTPWHASFLWSQEKSWWTATCPSKRVLCKQTLSS